MGARNEMLLAPTSGVIKHLDNRESRDPPIRIVQKSLHVPLKPVMLKHCARPF